MKKFQKLYSWYESLTENELNKIDEVYSHDAFFKDPFNEFRSREKIKNIFVQMFQKLQNPRFVFIDTLEEGSQSFVTWDFHFEVSGKRFVIHGSSHLKFDEHSKVIYHRDYWDVGEELLLKIPVLKSIYGTFRKKMGHA